MIQSARIRKPNPDQTVLVCANHNFCDGTAPTESCHRPHVSVLLTPHITAWAAPDRRRRSAIAGLQIFLKAQKSIL